MSDQTSYDKQWSAEDFDRYHNGRMADTERHSLEKAALEDPFLADALEGYAFASSPSQSLIELGKRLGTKKKKRGASWVAGTGISQSLKIAAILVVFIGLAWLLQRNIDRTDNAVVIAERKVAPPAKLADTVSNSQLADTAFGIVMDPPQPGTTRSIAIAPPQAGAELPAKSEFQRDTIQQQAAGTVDAKENAAIENIELFSREKQAAASTQNNRPLEGKVSGISIRNQNAIRGRVVDEAGAPVAFANIRDVENKVLLSADSDGYFILNNLKNIPNIKVDVNAAGYENNKVAISPSNAENTIVLQKNEAALSEVVVTGYGAKRKSNQVASARAEQSSTSHKMINVKFTNVSPVNGWPHMRRFLIDSVQQQPAYRALINNTRPLTISFDVDPLGRAMNLRPAILLSDSSAQVVSKLMQRLPSLKKIRASKTASITLGY